MSDEDENMDPQSSPRKRTTKDSDSREDMRKRARAQGFSSSDEDDDEETHVIRDVMDEVAGRIVRIELVNFMCHAHVSMDMNVANKNCVYIGGPNGSGKSALFAAMNIGLGGRGNTNDRGSSVKNYIKEGQKKAKIRIELTNKGQGAHPDYGDIAVVERTIVATGSTYVLKKIDGLGKNRGEEIVSRKKTDLDRLLIRYGIQLNNPVFWMSQDRCRQFLQQMKPDKLFQIFMHATELDHTRQCYEEADTMLKEINRILKVLQRQAGEMKADFIEKRTAYQQSRSLDQKRKNLNDLGWIILWAPLKDVLTKQLALEKLMSVLKHEREIIKFRVKENREQLIEMDAEAKKMSDEIEAHGKEHEKLTESFPEKKRVLLTRKAEMQQLTDSVKRIEEEKKSAVINLRQSNRRLAEEQRRLADDTKQKQIVHLQGQIKDMEDRKAVAKEECNLAEQEKLDANERLGELTPRLREIQQEEYRLNGLMRRLEEEKKVAVASTKHAVARFGADNPHIQRVVDENAHMFSHKPLGPIGSFIRVRDPRWAFVVEQAVGQRNMSAWVVSSQSDQRVLRDLLRGRKIPAPVIMTTRFGPRYDTRNNEPDARWKTVQREIDVSNDVVANVLCDFCQVESTILLDDDDNAKRLMDGDAPINGCKAFTASGATVMGRNQRYGGTYKFYPFHGDTRPRFLTDNKARDTNEIDTEMRQIHQQISQMRSDSQQLNHEVRQWKQKVDQAYRTSGAREDAARKADRELERLKRTLEDMQQHKNDDELNILKETVAEWEEKVRAHEEELEEAREIERDKVEEYEEMDDEFRTERMKAENFLKEVNPIKMSLDGIMQKTNMLHSGYEELMNADQQLRRKNEEYERREIELDKMKVEAEKEAEQAKGLAIPDGFADPPDMELIPTKAEAAESYLKLQREIRAAEAAIPKHLRIDKVGLEALHKDYQEQKKLLAALNSLYAKLVESLKLRQDKFPVMQHAIIMKLKASYQKLMAIRHYAGDLEVNVVKGTIDISATTHKKKAEGGNKDADEANAAAPTKGNVVQDLKGLSGGERSYTTACFIMSLWEIMEAPFRCMDEFDVFMDMVNRKAVMEMLVKLATETYSHNQFIFFTPQGLKELRASQKKAKIKGVHLIDMPKVRDM